MAKCKVIDQSTFKQVEERFCLKVLFPMQWLSNPLTSGNSSSGNRPQTVKIMSGQFIEYWYWNLTSIFTRNLCRRPDTPNKIAAGRYYNSLKCADTVKLLVRINVKNKIRIRINIITQRSFLCLRDSCAKWNSVNGFDFWAVTEKKKKCPRVKNYLQFCENYLKRLLFLPISTILWKSCSAVTEL